MSLGGVIPNEEIIQNFKNKHRRQKKKQKVTLVDDSDTEVV